eukprot:3966820-Amphidinium_carterae.1
MIALWCCLQLVSRTAEEMSVEDRRSLEVEAGKLRESREAHRRELLERELNAELDAISSPHVKLPAVGKRTSESAAVGTDTEVGDTDAPSKTRMTDTDTDENRERASSDDDLQTSVGGSRGRNLRTPSACRTPARSLLLTASRMVSMLPDLSIQAF